jgi:hypothetical protein
MHCCHLLADFSWPLIRRRLDRGFYAEHCVASCRFSLTATFAPTWLMIGCAGRLPLDSHRPLGGVFSDCQYRPGRMDPPRQILRCLGVMLRKIVRLLLVRPQASFPAARQTDPRATRIEIARRPHETFPSVDRSRTVPLFSSSCDDTSCVAPLSPTSSSYANGVPKFGQELWVVGRSRTWHGGGRR